MLYFVLRKRPARLFYFISLQQRQQHLMARQRKVEDPKVLVETMTQKGTSRIRQPSQPKVHRAKVMQVVHRGTRIQIPCSRSFSFFRVFLFVFLAKKKSKVDLLKKIRTLMLFNERRETRRNILGGTFYEDCCNIIVLSNYQVHR